MCAFNIDALGGYLDTLPSADCLLGHEPTRPAAPLQTTDVCNVMLCQPTTIVLTACNLVGMNVHPQHVSSV